MKEVLYTSWKHLNGICDVNCLGEKIIEDAKKYLRDNVKKSSSGSGVNYFYYGCLVKDLNNLGLKICSEDENNIRSLASKLFEDVSRA